MARRARSALQATRRLVVAHASTRSASFRNSLRGAAGLGVAVLIGQLAGLQHSFWVVLATLTALRSNALGTGSTVIQALAGTVAGIVVGGALVAALGSDELVLWALLPPAVLLAAYAPRAISFAAGQAGFTIALLILFNIIQPTGWTVGLVRVEHVAVGCAVSLAVGVLFWPRGVGDLMRESLGAAYARSADYVASATRRLVAAGRAGWVENATQPAREVATEGRQVVRCVREALAAGDDSMVGPALSLLWASQHLDNLRRLGVRLIQPAAEFSSKGARPADQPSGA